jgi:hypothetical protein
MPNRPVAEALHILTSVGHITRLNLRSIFVAASVDFTEVSLDRTPWRRRRVGLKHASASAIDRFTPIKCIVGYVDYAPQA